MPTTWCEIVLSRISELELPPTISDTVRAFPNLHPSPLPLPPGASSFVHIESHFLSKLPSLPSSLQSDLTFALNGDSDQAGIFSRRLKATAEMLIDLSSSSDAARLFAVALICRALETQSCKDISKDKFALRVRGLADFYYRSVGYTMKGRSCLSLRSPPLRSPSLPPPDHSKAAVIHHATRPSLSSTKVFPSLSSCISALSWSPIDPGLSHSVLSGSITEVSDAGPILVNLCKVSPSSHTFTCHSISSSSSKISASLVVSGGFFLYSESPIHPPSERLDPVGLLVKDGEVLGPPVFKRAAFLETKEDVDIRICDAVGWTVRW